MIKQEVVVLSNTPNIQLRINDVLAQRNNTGWHLAQITSHGTNISFWTLLFEKEEKKK